MAHSQQSQTEPCGSFMLNFGVCVFCFKDENQREEMTVIQGGRGEGGWADGTPNGLFSLIRCLKRLKECTCIVRLSKRFSEGSQHP